MKILLGVAILIFFASALFVNLARTPPRANIGMIGVASSLGLMAFLALWKIAAMIA